MKSTNPDINNPEKVKEEFKKNKALRYKLYMNRVKRELKILKMQTELDTWDSLGFPSIEELEKRDGFVVPDEITYGLSAFGNKSTEIGES